MFDCFLGKCQEGLNLAEMLDEQISVCKRELIQNKGESAADFAARAENAMSLFEELLRGSGFTNDQDERGVVQCDPEVDLLSLRVDGRDLLIPRGLSELYSFP